MNVNIALPVLMQLLFMREQVKDLAERLPPHIGSLLSGQEEVPRGEVARQVLAVLQKEDAERVQLEEKLRARVAMKEIVTRQYLQSRGLWHARGIVGAPLSACPAQALHVTVDDVVSHPSCVRCRACSGSKAGAP